MRSLVGLGAAVAVVLFGVASAQTEAPIAQPAALVAPAPSPSQVQDALIAYAAFQGDVSELATKQITSVGDIDYALERVSHHNRQNFVRGWIAYGAQVASQSPSFVHSVREASGQFGRDAVVAVIAGNRSYARRLAGGDEATQLVLSSVRADSARVASVADRYQEYAYVLQRQSWANAVASGQPARLQRMRDVAQPGVFSPTISISAAAQLAVTPLSVSIGTDSAAFGGARFWDAVSGMPGVVEVSSQAAIPWRASESRAEALDRMTSIAALQALGVAESQPAAITGYLDDQRSQDCVEMAQLQLYQCMSAARFVYENAFCLAEHGLREVSTCIGALGEPDVAAMTPISAPAPQAVQLSPLEGSDPGNIDPAAPVGAAPILVIAPAATAAPIEPIGAPSATP
jgi:hypothetical protein